jgi:hypothetical protein
VGVGATGSRVGFEFIFLGYYSVMRELLHCIDIGVAFGSLQV